MGPDPVLAKEIKDRFERIAEINQKFGEYYRKAESCERRCRGCSLHCDRSTFARVRRIIAHFQPLRLELNRTAQQSQSLFGRLSRPQISLSDGVPNSPPSDAKAGGASSSTREGGDL